MGGKKKLEVGVGKDGKTGDPVSNTGVRRKKKKKRHCENRKGTERLPYRENRKGPERKLG